MRFKILVAFLFAYFFALFILVLIYMPCHPINVIIIICSNEINVVTNICFHEVMIDFTLVFINIISVRVWSRILNYLNISLTVRIYYHPVLMLLQIMKTKLLQEQCRKHFHKYGWWIRDKVSINNPYNPWGTTKVVQILVSYFRVKVFVSEHDGPACRYFSNGGRLEHST